MMPHKKYFSAVIATAPASLAGIAWAAYGDDRALIEDLQARYLLPSTSQSAPKRRARSADPR
jgi:hypothetical protein